MRRLRSGADHTSSAAGAPPTVPTSESQTGSSIGGSLYTWLNYRPLPRREVFGSKHVDAVPVDTVLDVCYVLTFNEWARYNAENAQELLAGSGEAPLVERSVDDYPRRRLQPADDASIDNVSEIIEMTKNRSGLLLPAHDRSKVTAASAQPVVEVLIG